MKTFTNISLLFSVLLAMASCQEKTSTTTQSAVAQITAFAFASNDSIPGLGEAMFIVEQRTDTGLIRMRANDSVRYGTPLQKVVPRISYYTTPGAVIVYLGDSTVELTGNDTLNLSIKPIRIHVIAQNTAYDKWYKLDFDVHTMDGDLFHWDTIPVTASPYTHGTQKAMVRKDRFYYYQNDGYGVKLFTSDNQAEQWQEQTVSGLPIDCNVRQLVESDTYFFYGRQHDFYYSEDGINWSYVSVDTLNIVALYMCMKVRNIQDPNDSIRLWMAAVNTKGDSLFYTVGKDVVPYVAQCVGLPGGKLPADFPVEEYTTIPFQSSSLHEHALIAGGYDRNHRMTAARWNLEYNYVYNTYHLSNLAQGNTSLAPFAGSSASYYGKYLYLLGGIHEDRSMLTNIYYSVDEGVNWVEVTDTVNSRRPKDLNGRYHTNTFVHNMNLYIIGGEDNSTTYSDIYRGRMNSIAWPEIGN